MRILSLDLYPIWVTSQPTSAKNERSSACPSCRCRAGQVSSLQLSSSITLETFRFELQRNSYKAPRIDRSEIPLAFLRTFFEDSIRRSEGTCGGSATPSKPDLGKIGVLNDDSPGAAMLYKTSAQQPPVMIWQCVAGKTSDAPSAPGQEAHLLSPRLVRRQGRFRPTRRGSALPSGQPCPCKKRRQTCSEGRLPFFPRSFEEVSLFFPVPAG